MAAPAAAFQARSANRPNVLVLMSDQHSSHVLGCRGDKVARTPNLDGLAASGVLFENAYCQSPLCVPARASFLTGRQPHETRVWTNGDALPSDTPTFAHSLGAAGYDTALIGRMHFNGVDQWHGFAKRLVGSLSPMYPHLEYPLPPNLLEGAKGSSRDAIRVAGPGRTAYQVYDEQVTQATVEYLNQRGKDARKPFCAVAGFVLPHSPYICAKQDWDYYYDRVTVPQPPPREVEGLHPAIRAWRRNRGVEDLTIEEIRRARTGYYGLVTEFDRHVGSILDALKKSGLSENTVVVYTTDHGEMAGEHGMWWKSNFYEGAVSTPLIMAWPGNMPAGRRIPEIVSHVGPTLAALAGAEPLPSASGRSMAPLLSGSTQDWPNEAFSEYAPQLGVPATRMIRSGPWKLVHFDGMRPQMFNLEDDPGELRDLGESPAHAEVRRRLLARVLHGWPADEMKRELSRRAREQRLIRLWSQQVKPEAPQQWIAPEGSNVFTQPW